MTEKILGELCDWKCQLFRTGESLKITYLNDQKTLTVLRAVKGKIKVKKRSEQRND